MASSRVYTLIPVICARERQEVRVREGDMMTEAGPERDTGRCYATAFEDGGEGPEPRNTGSVQELEKAREWILS